MDHCGQKKGGGPKAQAKTTPSPQRVAPKPKKYELVSSGWPVPVVAPEDIRPDTAAVAALDDEKIAHELWVKCKNASKPIALVGPKDLKVGVAPPVMLLAPFTEVVEGLPPSTVDLQVWLHQLTDQSVTFASPHSCGCQTYFFCLPE